MLDALYEAQRVLPLLQCRVVHRRLRDVGHPGAGARLVLRGELLLLRSVGAGRQQGGKKPETGARKQCARLFLLFLHSFRWPNV